MIAYDAREKEDWLDKKNQPIPVKEAKELAEKYGWRVLVIVARGEDDREFVTTWGKHEGAILGDAIKNNVLRWPSSTQEIIEDFRIPGKEPKI